jgi:hypothetical protein
VLSRADWSLHFWQWGVRSNRIEADRTFIECVSRGASDSALPRHLGSAEIVCELQTRPENLSSSQFIELYNAICKEEAQRDGGDGLSDASTALLADSLP